MTRGLARLVLDGSSDLPVGSAHGRAECLLALPAWQAE
ncbi:hypothetical protein F4561_001371 [Lipingzhangella halophila]|uniref:Uncharacterized protein n=1 Tax=Lipingzhangella halophila TaxID=1783352 RepID=A0A7W7RFM8_9ACTN|nr:hypothetical protein [Lipingzhangella halophila]